MTCALVLRPEPGNTTTCARLAARGVRALAAPLFAVAPVAWEPPPADAFDALLLTSANAARHAGPALASYAALPVIAVGAATAAAARAAGLHIAHIGESDAAAAVAGVPARRLLHLAGRHRGYVAGATAVPVYESVELPFALRALAGADVALLHSPRAAARFAALVPIPQRGSLALATLAPAVAAAVGDGWRAVAAAPRPEDALLVALAAEMIDRSPVRVDKPWS